MPDEEQTEPADDAAVDEAPTTPTAGCSRPTGIGSAVLGALSVAAIALGALIWTGHRSDVDERTYQTRVMQAAADWTSVLINMNTDNIEASLHKLHDGTVGQLNADFESSIQPYQQAGADAAVAQPRPGRLRRDRSRCTTTWTPEPGGPAAARAAARVRRPRTDTVMVVATSVSENAGGKPQTVHWTLRLGVSDVDGKLLISRLESDPMRNRLAGTGLRRSRAARRDRRAAVHRHRAGLAAVVGIGVLGAVPADRRGHRRSTSLCCAAIR